MIILSKPMGIISLWLIKNISLVATLFDKKRKTSKLKNYMSNSKEISIELSSTLSHSRSGYLRST
jgi:hypothetical protein